MLTSFEVSIVRSKLDFLINRVSGFRAFPILPDDEPKTPAFLSEIEPLSSRLRCEVETVQGALKLPRRILCPSLPSVENEKHYEH